MAAIGRFDTADPFVEYWDQASTIIFSHVGVKSYTILQIRLFLLSWNHFSHKPLVNVDRFRFHKEINMRENIFTTMFQN